MFSCVLTVNYTKSSSNDEYSARKMILITQFCESHQELKKNSRWSEVTSILIAKIKIAITQKNQTLSKKKDMSLKF